MEQEDEEEAAASVAVGGARPLALLLVIALTLANWPPAAHCLKMADTVDELAAGRNNATFNQSTIGAPNVPTGSRPAPEVGRVTSDVLCNSRCDCLRLEFARRPRQRPSDKTAPLEQPDKLASERLNQLALIEFGQDYSFEDDGTPLAASLDEAELLDDRAATAATAAASAASVVESRSPLEPDETGSGPPLEPASASNRAGSGAAEHRAATIRMRGAGDQSSRRVNGSNNRTRIDQAPARPASTVPPTPLNGHALLLPSFKQQQERGLEAGEQSAAGFPFQLRATVGRFGVEGGKMDQQEEFELERISPLRKLNLSDTRLGATLVSQEGDQNLTRIVVEALRRIQSDEVESLALRNNELKFEQWTQLYSLLLVQMRARLHHLDLSHNGLVKLGVTFTGYIEHHFVYQLLRSNGTDTSWPFATAPLKAPTVAPQNSSSSRSATNETGGSMGSYLKLFQLPASGPAASSARSSAAASKARLFRRPLLGDGRLYNSVRRALPSLLDEWAQATSGGAQPEFANEIPDTPSWLEMGVTGSGGFGPAHANASGKQQQALVQLLLHQPARVRALDLSHNKLKWLINDQFRTLKRLQSIRLDHNRIRFIHQQAFNGLLELKYLNLNYNRLQTIYMEQFQTNYQLRALFMRANYLAYLRAGALAPLGQLRRLDLSRNKLAILSSNAFIGLDSLELLNLSSNAFVHVPSAAFHPLLKALKQLHLEDNQLVQLQPGAFFHFSQLERLQLARNEPLTSIDRGAFWDLPRLGHLSLHSSRQLQLINAQAFVGVPQLKSVELDECPLLDSRALQLIANLTMANTMRQILKQQLNATTTTTTSSSSSTNTTTTTTSNATTTTTKTSAFTNSSSPESELVQPLDLVANGTTRELLQRHRNASAEPAMAEPIISYQQQYQQQMSIQLAYDQTSATNKITKYFYSLAGLALVLTALKLLFHFTSTRHYLESRRRRRRVYETSADGGDGGGQQSQHLADPEQLSLDELRPPESLTASFQDSTEQLNDEHSLESTSCDYSSGGESIASADDQHMRPAGEMAPLEAPPGDDRSDFESASVAQTAASQLGACPDCLAASPPLSCCDQEPPLARPIGDYDNEALLCELAASNVLVCGLEQATTCAHCLQSLAQSGPACCSTQAGDNEADF